MSSPRLISGFASPALWTPRFTELAALDVVARPQLPPRCPHEFLATQKPRLGLPRLLFHRAAPGVDPMSILVYLCRAFGSSPLAQIHFYMASVIFGGGVSEIRGSIAGNVYGRNANGATIRNRTTPVNARTSRQVAVRNNLAGVAAAWRDLDDSQREGWIAAAPSFPYTNRLGQPSVYTGQQLFNALNMSLVAIGEGYISAAPSPMSTFGVIGSTALDASEGEVLANVSVPPGADWIVQAFSSGPVSAGVMRPNSVTFSLITQFPGDVLTFDMFDQYVARFGNLIAGQKAFFKYEAVSSLSGQRIAIGTHSAVVTA